MGGSDATPHLSKGAEFWSSVRERISASFPQLRQDSFLFLCRAFCAAPRGMLEEEQRILLWSRNRNHHAQHRSAAASYLSACRGGEGTPVRSVLGNSCCSLTETCLDDHTEKRICVLRGGAVAGGQVLSSQLPLLAPRALPASGFGNRLLSS